MLFVGHCPIGVNYEDVCHQRTNRQPVVHTQEDDHPLLQMVVLVVVVVLVLAFSLHVVHHRPTHPVKVVEVEAVEADQVQVEELEEESMQVGCHQHHVVHRLHS
jgi:anti-sigma-K factor RskA